MAVGDKCMAGGVKCMVTSHARPISGRNPFEGYTPLVPHGERLDFASEEFMALEDAGLKEAGRSAFVLVAGGLGERLGYSGAWYVFSTESSLCVCGCVFVVPVKVLD